LKPPSSEEYSYEPCEFANVDELELYEDRAIKESIDSIKKQSSLFRNITIMMSTS